MSKDKQPTAKEFRDQLTTISDDLNHSHLSQQEALLKLKELCASAQQSPVTDKFTARQFAVIAICEDKLNLRNPSILAKLLKEYASVQSTKEVTDKQIVEMADNYMKRFPDTDVHDWLKEAYIAGMKDKPKTDDWVSVKKR